MKKSRIDIKTILKNPVLKRKLIAQTIIAVQAREGIITTQEQAERAYDANAKREYKIMVTEMIDTLQRLQKFFTRMGKHAQREGVFAAKEHNQELIAYWQGVAMGYSQASKSVEYEIQCLKEEEEK